MSLSSDQIETYHEQGFISPFELFSSDEISAWIAELERIEGEQIEVHGEDWVSGLPTTAGDETHPLTEWLRTIVWDSRLVELVGSLVKGNIMLRNVDLFVKDGHTKQGVHWHMDSQYGGLNPGGIVTAWVALTKSRYSNGNLWFAPGSHRRPEVDKPQEEDCQVQARLYAPASQVRLDVGQVSLHHGRILHMSGGNSTPHRRLGLAIRYLGSETDTRSAKTGTGVLVSDRGKKDSQFKEKSVYPFTWWKPFDN